MTKITKEQFINQFSGKEGIDVNDLSTDTNAFFEKLGILPELTKIAGKDGKIKGSKELSELFKVVDNFDQNGSRTSFDTTFQQEIPTPSGIINDALKSEFNRNLTAARMNGPRSVYAKTSENTALPTEARVVKKGILETEFDFGRTITQEQAAKLIFKDGKIPEGTTLMQRHPGSGIWTVQTSDDDAQERMGNHMRAHTETIDRNNPGEFWISWSDSPKVSSVSIPKYLKNDYGFKISKSYQLDAREHWIPGTGYELNFDKPMTKDQVMKTLFKNSKELGKDDVTLLPDGKEPTQNWQAHISATAMVNVSVGIQEIFSDATANVPNSIRPDTPPGIRAQLENHTIPSDAVAHPKGKPHPPGVYVWEQESYLVYAVSDGKGKDGFYDAQILKLDSKKDSQFNKDMRYYLKEKGMPPYPAVAAYTKQWEELNRMMLTGFAMALSSASPGGKPTSAEFEQLGKDMIMEWRSVQKTATEEASDVVASVSKSAESEVGSELKSASEIGNADKLPKQTETIGTEPPQPKAQKSIGSQDTELPAQGAAPDGEMIKIQTPNGSEEISIAEFQKRIDQAWEWRNAIARKLSQETEGTKDYRTPASFWPRLNEEAAKKFDLPDDWALQPQIVN